MNTFTDYDLEIEALRDSLDRAHEAAVRLGVSLTTTLHADMSARPLSPPIAAIPLRPGALTKVDKGTHYAFVRSGSFLPRVPIIVTERNESKGPA